MKRVIFSIAAMLSLVLGVVTLLATPASASPGLTGEAQCTAQGWVANFHLTNTTNGEAMEVVSQSATTGSPSFASPIASGATANTQISAANSVASITVTVTVGWNWADDDDDSLDIYGPYSVTVNRPTACNGGSTPTITTPTPTIPVCIGANGIQVIDLNGDGLECLTTTTTTPPTTAPPTTAGGDVVPLPGPATPPAATPSAAAAPGIPTQLAFTGADTTVRYMTGFGLVLLGAGLGMVAFSRPRQAAA